MKRNLLRVALFGAAVLALGAYGLAGPVIPHECKDSEIWQFSCDDPGYCTNACGFYCPTAKDCIACCAHFKSNTSYSECISFCHHATFTPEDYLAD